MDITHWRKGTQDESLHFMQWCLCGEVGRGLALLQWGFCSTTGLKPANALKGIWIHVESENIESEVRCIRFLGYLPRLQSINKFDTTKSKVKYLLYVYNSASFLKQALDRNPTVIDTNEFKLPITASTPSKIFYSYRTKKYGYRSNWGGSFGSRIQSSPTALAVLHVLLNWCTAYIAANQYPMSIRWNFSEIC
jgi:hypothetical protein